MKVGLRNNICVKGEEATCGSKMLEKYISPYSSTVAEKLNKAGIEIKNIEIKEFGIEEDNYIKEFFEKNVADTAIVVDGNGEIARNSTNGLVGLKPTFGLISRWGVIMTSPSLEQVGVISKNIEDLKEVLDIVKGYDEKDSGSIKNISVCDENNNKELKVADIKEVKIDSLKYAKVVTYMISSAETSSNLGRLDGIRYGYRTKDASNWKEVYTKTRQEGFSYEAKKKMIAGTFFLDVNNMEEYYKKAEKVRAMIKREIEKVFEKVDVLKVAADSEYTCLANLTGRPAISINGVTLIGKFFEEDRLISLAKTLGGGK